MEHESYLNIRNVLSLFPLPGLGGLCNTRITMQMKFGYLHFIWLSPDKVWPK